jgi:hypothetical protein
MELEITKISINMKARDWCLLPYPDHPKGCPNYNDPKHEGICPPSAPLIHDFIDVEKPMYLIVEEFDLDAHVKQWLIKHPTNTLRQAKCVRYWQNSVQARLRRRCEAFKQINPGFVTTLCPEAMGVNVISTAKYAGIPIKPKPEGIVYKIALAGVPHGNGKRNNIGTDELLSSQLPLLF